MAQLSVQTPRRDLGHQPGRLAITFVTFCSQSFHCTIVWRND
jgi:hypothetical protein